MYTRSSRPELIANALDSDQTDHHGSRFFLDAFGPKNKVGAVLLGTSTL